MSPNFESAESSAGPADISGESSNTPDDAPSLALGEWRAAAMGNAEHMAQVAHALDQLNALTAEVEAFGVGGDVASAEQASEARRDDSAPLGVVPDAPERQTPAAALAQLKAKIEEQRVANDAGLARLAAMGIGMQIQSVNMIQFAIALDMLMGDGESPTRLAYELRVQQAIATMVEEGLNKSSRAKLLAPAPAMPGQGLPSGLIRGR